MRQLPGTIVRAESVANPAQYRKARVNQSNGTGRLTPGRSPIPIWDKSGYMKKGKLMGSTSKAINHVRQPLTRTCHQSKTCTKGLRISGHAMATNWRLPWATVLSHCLPLVHPHNT